MPGTEDRITFVDVPRTNNVPKLIRWFNRFLGLPEDDSRLEAFAFLRRENNTGIIPGKLVVFLLIVDSMFGVSTMFDAPIYTALSLAAPFNFLIISAYSLYYSRNSDGKLDYGRIMTNLFIGILLVPLSLIGSYILKISFVYLIFIMMVI